MLFVRTKQKMALQLSHCFTLVSRSLLFSCKILLGKLRLRVALIAKNRLILEPKLSDVVVWISQYYNSPYPQRQQEIDFSIFSNSRLSWTTQCIIHLDGEALLPFPANCKLISTKRLLFKDYLELVDNLGRTSPGSLVLLTNSDIELTHDVPRLFPWIGNGDIICLSRHEPRQFTFVYPPEWFQDCWIMRSQILPWRLIEAARFNLGVPGCDNRFAALMQEAGFTIWNPCINTRAYHHHQSSLRTHAPSERIQGAYYEPYACTREELILRRNPGGRLRLVN